MEGIYACMGILLFFGFCTIWAGIDEPIVIVIGCILLAAAGLVFLVGKIINAQKIKKAKIRDQKARMKYKDMMPSSYLFPVEKFYRTCKAQKWTNTKNDVHVRKMILIAQNLIKEDKVESNYVYDTYTTKEQVVKFFELIHKQELEKKAIEKKRLEEEKLVPKETSLTLRDKELKDFNEKCKNYKYIEKRQEYLKYLISVANKEKIVANSHYRSAQKTTNAVRATTQEKDWAIAGGIANAIAGPAAGIMAASQTIEENERNKDYNQAIRRYAYGKESEAFSRVCKAEGKIENYKNKLNNLDSKIVFDEVSSEELYKHLKFKAEMSGGFGKLKLSIENNYPENPQLKTVIDGTVQVKVYYDEFFLDDVCVALPCYGVACGKTNTAYTFLKQAMISPTNNYTFEITPNFLWLMEK